QWSTPTECPRCHIPGPRQTNSAAPAAGEQPQVVQPILLLPLPAFPAVPAVVTKLAAVYRCKLQHYDSAVWPVPALLQPQQDAPPICGVAPSAAPAIFRPAAAQSTPRRIG